MARIKGGKFVIAGGLSQIGSEITAHLLEGGAREVLLFDNFALGSAETVSGLLADERVKLVRGDVLRTNELYDAFEDAVGCFAVAGFLTLPLTLNPSLGLAVNVQGMLNICEASRYRGGVKIIFSSSVAVYGETEEDVTAEGAPWAWSRQQPGAALYGGSKIIGENLGRLYHGRYGVPFVSLRYASVYGERQHRRAVNSAYIVDTIDSIRRGERPVIPDDGSEVHDYIHIEDIAHANIMAMASDVSGESFNVATGTSTSLNELVSIILREMGSGLTPEHRKIEGKIRATVSSTLKFSNARIADRLGWRPRISLDEGIRRIIRWTESGIAAA
ncbi:MAG: NAD-dependent epimerase/dehydratase family protein [Rhizobiaceae bacterium]